MSLAQFQELENSMPEEKEEYEFKCPECGFDHHEHGKLATRSQIHCGICAGDCGTDVFLNKTLSAKKTKGGGYELGR